MQTTSPDEMGLGACPSILPLKIQNGGGENEKVARDGAYNYQVFLKDF